MLCTWNDKGQKVRPTVKIKVLEEITHNNPLTE